MNIENQYQEKKVYFDNLRRKYEDNGEINWNQFVANQKANKGKVVLVDNDDFVNGTLRVLQPCMIKLTENIQFNPNRPTTWLNSSNVVTNDFEQAVKIDPNRVLDWMPSLSATDNNQYFESEVKFAYSLGFFAAITIEGQDIILDLNRYTLEQHPEHALQQRFYANVELADQPFIPFQGPSNFGSILRAAKNLAIINGTIGLSSHHGVHGNNAEYVLVDNVNFTNFEVASIALNGSKQVCIVNSSADSNRQDIPVLGTYSAGRFIKSFVKTVQDKGISTSTLNSASTALNNELDSVFNKVIFNNGSIPSYMNNNSGLIDGNPYGMLFNTKGVAVNAPLEDRDSSAANQTTDIYLENVSISNIHGKINEIVTIGNGSNSAQIDTAGAVLQFFNGVSSLSSGRYYYSGTNLSNVQIELAKIKTAREESNQDVSFFGTLNITKGVQLWKDNSDYYFIVNGNKQLQLRNGNGSNITFNGNSVVYEIFCNGDTMFHVNKGVFGLRVDGVNHMYMNNVTISNVKNEGDKGSLISGSYVKSHPAQSSLVGYHGARTFGSTFYAVNDLVLNNFTINGVESINSIANGLELKNYSSNLNLENINIKKIKAATNETYGDYIYGTTNTLPKASNLFIDDGLFNVNLKNINLDEPKNMTDYPYKPESCIINSQVHFE